MSDSLWPHRLYSPWSSPGQNTGVGSLSLLQGIFPTQASNRVSCIEGRFFTNWVMREAINPLTSGKCQRSVQYKSTNPHVNSHNTLQTSSSFRSIQPLFIRFLFTQLNFVTKTFCLYWHKYTGICVCHGQGQTCQAGQLRSLICGFGSKILHTWSYSSRMNKYFLTGCVRIQTPSLLTFTLPSFLDTR